MTSFFALEMPNVKEIAKDVYHGVLVLGGVALLGTGGYALHEADERQRAEHQRQVDERKQERERACSLKQEVAYFTGGLNADCSYWSLTSETTYDSFLHDAYFHRNPVSLDQEQAWLTRGDEIGKKIDPQKDFTRELCLTTKRELYNSISFLYPISSISFLERCEMEYKVGGINAAMSAYAFLQRAAEYCVINDLPTTGNDICYKRAVSDLEQFVRPLAERSGVAELMWMNVIQLENASRPAK